VDDIYAVPYADILLVENPGVLENDTFDGEPAENAGAVIDLVISDVTHGTLILNSDGSFSYDPFADFPGVDSFTYQASVGAETSQATVTLSACDTGPTVFTCWKEAPYLAKLGELGYGTFQEGFEDDAAWGSVRSPNTALSVLSQGIVWQTNYPDPPSPTKSRPGADRRGRVCGGVTTPTMALGEGSPAIDAGASVGCPATDQRGVGRPIDGDKDGTATCDIGAFEFQPMVIFMDSFESGDTSAWSTTMP
jgi:hypothetical protein